MEKLSLESAVTLRQAYLVMFEFLERQWEHLDRPEVLGAHFSVASLFGVTRMDAARLWTLQFFQNGLNALSA